MSDLVSLKLRGAGALQAQLLELGVETAVKALAQAARVAFKPVLEAAQAMTPTYSGALRAALKLRVVKPKGEDAPVVVVGIAIGAGPKDSAGGALLGKEELPPARRWHFIELGTAKLAAHPFLRPALDQKAQEVVDRLKIEIAKSIAKVLQKKAASASAGSWNTLGAFLE